MNEERRLATLQGYAILDTPAEAAFDAIARQMARDFRVPSALVSFIDDDRQWYKARVGVDAAWVPRTVSFCTHSIHHAEVTVVPDARLDERFRRSPMVAGPGGIRFYAAAPIRALNGARIGTVCIFDRIPRAAMTLREQRLLSRFAADVTELLEKRRFAAHTRKPAASVA